MLRINKPPALFICTLLLLILLAACEQNRYKAAETLYSNRRYAAAIEQLDYYIRTGNNGAFVTRAELIRSNCYYELGLAAIDKENWNLAIRLLKLANSESADAQLAEVYMILAQKAIETNDISKGMSNLTLIITEISQSDLVPASLNLRIGLYLDNYNDKIAAWQDYMLLYDNYPEHPSEVQARKLVERFIGSNIDEAVQKAIKKDYDTALEELFLIRRYPVGDQNRIDLEISNIYQELAELEIQKTDYFEANRLFLKAMQYYPDKQDIINKRLRDIAYLYVDKGNDYLSKRDFPNALLYYQKTFEIIPDFDLARQAIANLRSIQNNIKKASDLASEAEKMEAVKNYAEAKRLFSEAYLLDKLPGYNESAIIMGNLIEAEIDPIAFARRIINGYKEGLLYRRIQAQKQAFLKKYTNDEIRDTGWKILRSAGQYKYEARYDLLTPSENLYYIWQINLRDRTIVPLNKNSEKIML